MEKHVCVSYTDIKLPLSYMHIYFNYIQGSGSWSSSWHVKVASGLSAVNESLTFFLSFLYLAFPLMLGGQGPAMAYCKKHVIKN